MGSVACSKALFPSFSYRRYAQSMHSLASAAGVGRKEEQEGKDMEAKQMECPWSELENEAFFITYLCKT